MAYGTHSIKSCLSLPTTSDSEAMPKIGYWPCCYWQDLEYYWLTYEEYLTWRRTFYNVHRGDAVSEFHYLVNVHQLITYVDDGVLHYLICVSDVEAFQANANATR